MKKDRAQSSDASRIRAGARAAIRSALGLAPAWEVDPYGRDLHLWEEVRPALDWLFESWLAVDARGLERLSAQRPTLLVANRAGLLPWDALLLMVAAERQGIPLRPLLEDETMDLPFVGVLASRLGAVRACRENAERLLGEGGAVAVFPEGGPAAQKRYASRYRLEPFGEGFVHLAKRLGARILPVAIVGAEEANPILAKIDLSALRLPPLPVTPTFPWLGPLGLLPLPKKWTIEIGAPIEPGPLETAREQAGAIREALQQVLDRGLGRSGEPSPR